jgi:ketosteroid isomerase-like protein
MSAQDLLEKYKIEINTHDFNKVSPLLSEDCTFWFSSGTYVGLQATQQAFEKTWQLIKNEVYTISDTQWISESDKSAVCIYTYHWKGLINGVECEGLGRGTSCFRAENGNWKIIHEHLSPFPNNG